MRRTMTSMFCLYIDCSHESLLPILNPCRAYESPALLSQRASFDLTSSVCKIYHHNDCAGLDRFALLVRTAAPPINFAR